MSMSLMWKQWRAKWRNLILVLRLLQETHRNYTSTVSQFTKLQTQCVKEVSHQQKRIKQLTSQLSRYDNHCMYSS